MEAVWITSVSAPAHADSHPIDPAAIPLVVDDPSSDEGTSLLQIDARICQGHAAVPTTEEYVGETTPQTAVVSCTHAIPTPLGRVRVPRQLLQSRARKSAAVEPTPTVKWQAPSHSAAKPHRPILRLDDYLGSPPHTRLKPNVVPESFLDIFQPFGLHAFSSALALIPDLHNNTLAALSTLPTWDGRTEPDAVQLYVDGSYFDETAAPA